MPKNPNGTGTIRKRPNGSWEARVTVGRDPETGRQIRKSFYGKTQAEVNRKIRTAAGDIDRS